MLFFDVEKKIKTNIYVNCLLACYQYMFSSKTQTDRQTNELQILIGIRFRFFGTIEMVI